MAYLCYFAKSSAFLAEVDHNTAAAILCFFYRLLDAEDEIRPARADVGAEDIASIALPDVSQQVTSKEILMATYLIVDAQCEPLGRI
jgi:hypothetical protein